MDERFLPDWDDNALSLGRPKAMDTPTLIEYIERQLETDEEGAAREWERKRLHADWHEAHPGIYTCCINTNWTKLVGGSIQADKIVTGAILTPNEIRSMSSEEKERIKDDFIEKSEGGKMVYLDEGMEIQYMFPEQVHDVNEQVDHVNEQMKRYFTSHQAYLTVRSKHEVKRRRNARQWIYAITSGILLLVGAGTFLVSALTYHQEWMTGTLVCAMAAGVLATAIEKEEDKTE